MIANDLHLVSEVIQTLRGAGLEIWLFGGWAEELRGVRAPGPHGDIDLLLRDSTFTRFDAVLTAHPSLNEIPEKRFSHKRAFVWDGVRVEVFLVRPGAPDTSSILDDRVVVHWPDDTFVRAPISGLEVASEAALALYRRNHKQVRRAYAAFRAAHSSAG